nr:flavodoxin family protein [uncultured Faecalimonas sp.]
MAKKVLIISTSLRSGSNSEALADAFLQGASEAGNQTEKISLKGKNIQFCRGCLACIRTKQCVIKDDVPEIAEKMRVADVIVFASPIYYYEMSGQMKTLLDRANSLYKSEYAFRDIYFLSSAAEDGEQVDSRAIGGLGGWIDCYPKARFAGKVFAGGVDDAGKMEGHPALEKAYRMGKAIT